MSDRKLDKRKFGELGNQFHCLFCITPRDKNGVSLAFTGIYHR